jgi:FtsZ-binding cell division protein ZapB
MEESKQRRRKEELEKTEEQIKENHREGQDGNILRAYVTRSWNFKEQDVLI